MNGNGAKINSEVDNFYLMYYNVLLDITSQQYGIVMGNLVDWLGGY